MCILLSRGLLDVLLLLVIALQVADIVTTYLIIQRGGRELNPLIAAAMAKIGVLPALLVTKGALIALMVSVNHVEGMIYVFAFLAALYAFVISNNLRVLRRLAQ